MNNVFPESMGHTDPAAPEYSIEVMDNYIRYMCERIDFAMENMARAAASGVSYDIYRRLGQVESDVTTCESDVAALNANKVDKVNGKGLSTNDYDDTSKYKLDNLADIETIGTGLALNDGELSATGGGGGGAFSFIGMVVQSTTLATLSDVQAIYGSDTTWVQHDGYILRGPSSSVTANSATSDGGADTVTPSTANGYVGNTTLTAAQSGVPAHSHSVSTNASTSGGPSNNATGSGGNWNFVSRGLAWWNNFTSNLVAGTNTTVSAASDNRIRRVTNNADATLVTGGTSQINHAGHAHTLNNHTHSIPALSGTASNNSAANASQSHTHTFTGQSHTNLPKYKNVYIWERTA